MIWEAHPTQKPIYRPYFVNILEAGMDAHAVPPRKTATVNALRASDPPRAFADNGPIVIIAVDVVSVKAQPNARRTILINALRTDALSSSSSSSSLDACPAADVTVVTPFGFTKLASSRVPPELFILAEDVYDRWTRVYMFIINAILIMNDIISYI